MSYDLLRFSLLFRRFVTVKADDSVPPFFTESEFRTLHLFRAPPSSYNQSTKPNRPTLRVGRPKARRQNVRVLSRRSNLPKAVACGYSEGAGFVVLTELPWPRPPAPPVAPHPPLRGRPWALSRFLLGRPGRRCALVCPLALSCQTQQRPSALRRCSGGDDSSTASASCVRGAEAT